MRNMSFVFLIPYVNFVIFFCIIVPFFLLSKKINRKRRRTILHCHSCIFTNTKKPYYNNTSASAGTITRDIHYDEKYAKKSIKQYANKTKVICADLLDFILI